MTAEAATPEFKLLVAIKHCIENPGLSSFLSSRKSYETFINSLVDRLLTDSGFRSEFLETGGNMSFLVGKDGQLKEIEVEDDA